MVEVVSFFREFGYPALISGLLIWFIVSKLEQMRLTNEKLIASNDGLYKSINEKLEQMEEAIETSRSTMHRLELYLDRLEQQRKDKSQ